MQPQPWERAAEKSGSVTYLGSRRYLSRYIFLLSRIISGSLVNNKSWKNAPFSAIAVYTCTNWHKLEKITAKSAPCSRQTVPKRLFGSYVPFPALSGQCQLITWCYIKWDCLFAELSDRLLFKILRHNLESSMSQRNYGILIRRIKLVPIRSCCRVRDQRNTFRTL